MDARQVRGCRDDSAGVAGGPGEHVGYVGGGLNVKDPIQAAKAVHRYNNSAAYVANVLAWSAGYSSGIIPAAADLPRIH